MNKLLALFKPSDHEGSLGEFFRKKRISVFKYLFDQTFKNQDVINILDVGGTEQFWKTTEFVNSPKVNITLLNLFESNSLNPNIKCVVGDATSMPEYADQEFDLVFSNSVIEHLYNIDNQKQMAIEVQRVGKFYFVQTPYKYFFIEAHYALPFFQFIPKSIAFNILTKTKLSRMQKWDSNYAKQYLQEIRLLSLTDMHSLFPKSKFYKERFLGMTKSITAHNMIF